MTEFIFNSPFKEHIQGMILQKRSMGYKYDDSCSRVLYKFDQFCLTHSCTEPVLSKDLVQIWAQKHPNEAQATFLSRVGIIRQLAMYMDRIGVRAYVFPKTSFEKGANTFHTSSAMKSLQRFLNRRMLVITIQKFRTDM